MADWKASDGQTTHSFSNEEFLAAFNRLKAAHTQNEIEFRRKFEEFLGIQGSNKSAPPTSKNKPADPAAQRREIEQELDIIRGRIPTPKGYKVDTLRVKKLMQELKQLN